MRNMGFLAVFTALLLTLPLSWWLVGRSWRDPRARRISDRRAEADRISAATGLNVPAGGGDSA
ncbi:MAG: hypothetical protein Q8S29_21160 [Phreatobacter sp.]|nr:hypothetical protein [Phreatobacter sp.]